MAITTRRYRWTGANLAAIQNNGDPGTVLPALGYAALVDVTFNDAISDAIVVDDQMAPLGFVFVTAAPVGPPALTITPGVESLAADGAASPTIETTFVSGVGTDLTLANGLTNGFIKRFIVTGGTGTIIPASMAGGISLAYSTVVTLGVTSPASVSFIWDATMAMWHLLGVPFGMTLT